MRKSLLLAIVFVLLAKQIACAQTPLPNQISVNPSIVRLDLATDKPEVKLTYTNSSPDTLNLTFTAQNFTSLEEGERLSFLNPKDVNNYKYGLSSWIQFSTKSLVLDPGESTTITVFVEAQKLSPGGHYASILASVNPDESSKQPVGLKAVLGSLLFVRTHSGQENDAAQIASFDLERSMLDFPDTPSFRFDNTGDTDLTPYGVIEILDSHNQLVAKGIINEASSLTLPQSIRRYYTSLRTLKSFILPGVYTAKLSIHFGDSQKKLTRQIVFLSQGSISLPIVLIILIAGLAIFLWYRREKNLKNLK